jgi:hypothetical protein
MRSKKNRRRVETSATAFARMGGGVIRNPPSMSLHAVKKWL